jgi:hypothetical protein
MSLETILESAITYVVAKAAAWEADIAGAVEVVEADVELFFQWMASEMPAVTSAVQTVEGLVNQAQAAGVPLPSSVTSDLGALNTAVAGLNAAAAATNSGANPAQSVLALYTAVKQANGAAASLSTATIAAAGPTPTVAVALTPAA